MAMKIRDYLTGRGINDSDITYNNGQVMVKGKNFIGATPQSDNYTYGDPNKLNQAFNAYNMNDALDTFKSNLAKPREQFSYDANSDPLYQNALGAAQRSAQTAGNNATVRLGARGIGNSQQALTTENQIQQRSVADVNSNILPQLMSQAYSRYNDAQNRDDARNRDILGLAGTYNDLGQQGFNNDRLTASDARQKQMDHLEYAQMLSDKFGVYVEPKDDPTLALEQVKGLKPLSEREYEDKRADVAFNQGIQQRTTDANINNMNADNARISSGSTSKPGGTSAKPSATSYKQDLGFFDDMAELRKSPTIAISTIEGNRKALIEAYGPDGYMALLKEAERLQGIKEKALAEEE